MGGLAGGAPRTDAQLGPERWAAVYKAAKFATDGVGYKRSQLFADAMLGSVTGSGVVHRQPGGALCIVPVHSQHRGRLFLPFADNDPKTAEVIAKALLLAKDHEIKDPTILEQIMA